MPPRHVYWTIIYGNQATSFRASTPEELLPTLKQLQSRHPDAVLKYFARGRLWDSAEEARPRRDGPRDPRPRYDSWRDERRAGGPPPQHRSTGERRPAGPAPQHGPRDEQRPGGRPPQHGPRDERQPGGRPPQHGLKDERGRNRREPAGQPQTRGQDTERRGKDWRPGGQHKDPRDRWKVPRDVKRKRFAQRLRRDAADRQQERPGKPDRTNHERRPPAPDHRRGRRPDGRPPKKDRDE